MFAMISAQRFRPSIPPCYPVHSTVCFLMAEFRLKVLFFHGLPVSRQKAITVSIKSFFLPDVNPLFLASPPASQFDFFRIRASPNGIFSIQLPYFIFSFPPSFRPFPSGRPAHFHAPQPVPCRREKTTGRKEDRQEVIPLLFCPDTPDSIVGGRATVNIVLRRFGQIHPEDEGTPGRRTGERRNGKVPDSGFFFVSESC